MIKENHGPLDSLRETLGLPRQDTLVTTNFCIDLARDDQMSEMFQMIHEAMHQGEGYGVDEFQTEEDFICDINGGPSFAAVNSKTGKMVAGFSLSHSKYYRGAGIQAVDPVIIVKKSMRGQGLGEFIFQICIEFAKKLNYAGMYADTFTNNIPMVKIIEKRPNFQRVGTLPLGGRMPDGTVVGMNLYYMDLTRDDSESATQAASASDSLDE